MHFAILYADDIIDWYRIGAFNKALFDDLYDLFWSFSKVSAKFAAKLCLIQQVLTALYLQPKDWKSLCGIS